jgi:ADP-ribosylglycohydrolase
MKNIWLDGVMGVVIGDALGCPVQFEDRETVRLHPIGSMTGGLAGLYYGYDTIPSDWLAQIKRREWIEDLCRDVIK